MQYGLFYSDEVLLAQDLQDALSGINSSFGNYNANTSFPSTVLLTGGTVSAMSPASTGVNLSALTAVQNGQMLAVDSTIQVNILANSYAYGQGQAAGSLPRIDVVCIQYTAAQTNEQTRTFESTQNGQTVQTTQNVAVTQTDSFTVQVVHGTPASAPTAPAVPAGWIGLAQVAVPANATTITSGITDISSTYRTDGGRLSLSSGGLLSWINNTTVGMPSGSTFQIGSNALTDSNGTLTLAGGNGLNVQMPFTTQGITIPSGYTLKNNGSYDGSPLVTSITAGSGINVTNPTSPGAATVSVNNVPNSSLAGPLVSGLTATNGLSVTNPAGVGSGQYSLVLNGTTLNLNSSGLFLNLARANTWTANQTAPAWGVTGLTGATAATRYVGGTASGSPTTGTFAVGDFVVDQSGQMWICTVAGSPGTWLAPGHPVSAFQQNFTATANQTLFTLTSGSYSPGTNTMQVYVAGVRQDIGTAFTETSATSITLSQGVPAGTDVTLYWTEVVPPISQQLPAATATSLGAVQIGSGINVTSTGVISVATIPDASTTATGSVEVTQDPASGSPQAVTVVANPGEQELTGTSATDVLTFTPTTNGRFVLKGYLRVVTAATTVTATLTYTSNGGAQTWTMFSSQSVGVGEYSLETFAFQALSGDAITFSFTADTANQVYVDPWLIAE